MYRNFLATFAQISVFGLALASPAWSEEDYKTYRVDALVVNESAEPVEVILLNQGPHEGGCDGKNYVKFDVAANQLRTVGDSWNCKVPQIFEVMIKRGDQVLLKVSKAKANVLCEGSGKCRELQIR